VIPSGSSEFKATLRGRSFQIFTYRPAGEVSGFLFLFHGNRRNAADHRDFAIDFADRQALTVIVPLFDKGRFPSSSYQRGNVAGRSGSARQRVEVLPREEWTVELVAPLVEWARQREKRPDLPVFLFGHSAGGQFLSRVAAYEFPPGVERLVIANPSTYVMPTADEDAPYGFGGLCRGAALTDQLRQYLAAPVTIFLGLDDASEEDLTRNQPAMRQGNNRLERGQRVFKLASRLAKENAWVFNWRLIYAEGVGHTTRGMLNAREVKEAFGFRAP
jgi:pimeloyl-ACP methyl ester carboxylesterase